MKHSIRISLRAGEVVFVNGAMVRVDRKTSLEFLNDVTFLLGNHMIEPEGATTPLKKMYVILQNLLTDPSSGFQTRQSFYEVHAQIIAAAPSEELVAGLEKIRALVNVGRTFESLKALRKLFELEEQIIFQLNNQPAETANVAIGK